MTINTFLSLISLLTSLAQTPLPIRTSYSIAKFLSSTKEDYSFFQSRLSDFLQTYVARDENNQPIRSSNGAGYVIQPDKREEGIRAMNEIMNFEIETPELKIYYDDIKDIELSPKDLMVLMPYIIT